ncbi:hypothetical protein R1flu_002763 [Riccia fluitans]|uniref:Uncharacterized protein n=1 Tax=Riccia fluitans TaxID=41844 RepID=A0ABD1Y716_9MARC
MGNIARRRSRVQWLQNGEVASKYFFILLRVKHAAKRMNKLVQEDNMATEDEDIIIEEIHDFYLTLYTRNEEIREHEAKEKEIVRLIDMGVTDEENERISRAPGMEQLEWIATMLPKDKSL